MNFYILTLFPEVFRGYLEASILGKSIDKGLNRVKLVNIRDFATDKHNTCDDAPYGGGPGMLLKAEPLAHALDSIGGRERRTVYLSPAGKLFQQRFAEELAWEEDIVLVCGHYEGIDQRIIDLYVDDEISIGDYILFSGEVAAMVILDATIRLVNGVIKAESKGDESFATGLLEYPQYTRPRNFRDAGVPEVLLSGHHAEIHNWRLKKSLEKTLKMRPDLLRQRQPTENEIRILESMRQEEQADGLAQNDRS